MSVQQPLIHLIDSRIPRGQGEVIGVSVSPAYRGFNANLNEYTWVMDVDVGGDGLRPDSNTIAKAIIIADASHGVHKVGPGTKVRLRRTELKRTYEITGVAALTAGQVHVLEVTYFATGYSQGATTTYGSSYSLLNYSDLGDAPSNGGYTYGKLPYGTLGKYNAQGDLQYVIVTP